MSITVYELEDIRMTSKKMCYKVYNHLRQDKQYKDVKLVKTHILPAYNSSGEDKGVYHGDIPPGDCVDRVFIIGHDDKMSGTIGYRLGCYYYSIILDKTKYKNYNILVINLDSNIVNKGFTLTLYRKEPP